MKDEKIFQACLDKWGEDFQITLSLEEMGELIEQLGKTIARINQFKRCRVTDDETMEEIVDVSLMMHQLRLLDKEKFDRIYEMKIERLKKRLK